jgi:hypothetical protein
MILDNGRAESSYHLDDRDDTEEVPIGAQARAVAMQAAMLRKQAAKAPEEIGAALLREAENLEAHALRMAFEE